MNQFRMRLIFVSVLLTIALAAVVWRLFTIQIVDGEKYALRSRDQVQRRRIINAGRGAIYDRAGSPLALYRDMTGSADSASAGRMVSQRVYPQGDIAGSLLGYVGRDGYGLGGVEFTFDHILRGEDGWEIVQKDGRQRMYRKPGQPGKSPRDGGDVYLTIDLNLQKIVQSALRQTVDSLDAKGAMAIVMDPYTGRILAMANEPSFDPNAVSSFSMAARLNRTISQIYEPGSTFKAVTAAVALHERMVSEGDLIDANKGIFEIYGEVIRDDVPRDSITFSRAMAVSSNVCFARVANRFSNDLFFRYSRDFGFGVKSGVALPGEESGVLHPVRVWSGRTRVTMAMGYEVSATFLQMMMAYGAIVNGGILYSPIICEKAVARDGTVILTAEVKPVRRVISEETSLRLRRMLGEVVEMGTGRQAAVSGVSAGGKTGTSRKLDPDGRYSRERHWSSFIGFLPVENPTLLCGVLIDEPAGALGGGAAAAPVFRKIMSQVLVHPELEFGDRILKKPTADRQDAQTKVSELSGRAQSAGTFTNANGVMLDRAAKTVPDVVGKDLGDAIRMFSAGGFSITANVYVADRGGRGIVIRQSAEPGVRLGPTEVCTLYTDRK